MARRPKRADGRRLRGGRTRRRLVDAYLALVEEGEPRPRAADVATRAGVSLRTVYHHFERLSDLAIVALESGSTKRLRTLADPATEGSLSGRIGAFVESRAELFDAAAGLAQATVAVGQPTRSLETAPGSRSVLRRQMERTFAEELGDTSAPTARLLLDAVDAVSSADTWAYLRSELGRGAPESRAIVEETLSLLLAPAARGRRAATSG